MDHVDVAVIGGGPAGLAASRELTRAATRASGARASPCRRVLARTLGQFSPGDAELVDSAARARLRRVGSGRLHGARRGRCVPGALRGGSRGARSRGCRGRLAGVSPGRGLRPSDVVGRSSRRLPWLSPPAPTGLVPAGRAGTLPVDLLQLDVGDYRNERALPPGRVLVVGSGQSGCQIAEELHDAGREVFLACGKAPWAPRRLGGRDLVWWAAETGFLDMPAESLPTPAARLGANVLVTGHGGGRDLNLRTLRERGVTLTGHFLGARRGRRGSRRIWPRALPGVTSGTSSS